MDLEHPNGNQNHMQRNYNSQKIYTINFQIPEGYSLNLEYLGGGTYGNVVKSEVLCRDGVRRVVAIKKLKDPFMDALQARRIYREIKLLQLIRHDNIIRAIDLYTPNRSEHEFRDIYLVTEYGGNSLAKVLQNQRDLGRTLINPEHVQFIIYQLLRAVKYLHSVAPGNLALTKDCDLTVLDFGLARSLERKDTGLTQYVMTRWYRSPEVIYWKIGNYSTQADIWSIGCIAAELMTGTPIFEGEDANSQYESIIKITGSPSSELLDMIEQENGKAMRNVIEHYTHQKRVDFQDYFRDYGQGFADFLDQILVLDPEQRLTVDQALAHPYMSSYHDIADEPSADWTLVDDEEKSLAEWKNIIWREVTGFSGDQESPLVPF